MKRLEKRLFSARIFIWAIVPVAIALSFLLQPLPKNWGIYALYTTIAKLSPFPSAPVLKTVFPHEDVQTEPAPSVAIVEKTAPTGSLLNQTDYQPDLSKTEIPVLHDAAPQVLIVHTHTCESYTPSETYRYTPTDNDRTDDADFNMIRIGKEAKRVLEEMGISVLHDETVCDLPSYNGSYKNSLAVMEKQLKAHPSISVILDLHRDAIELSDGSKVKLSTTLDGKTVAQAMAVVGTDASGQSHPAWQKNLAFANAIQQTADRLSPGLMRPINLRTGRFNQQVLPGTLLFEIGTSGNTLEEALLCAQHLARAIGTTLKKGNV